MGMNRQAVVLPLNGARGSASRRRFRRPLENAVEWVVLEQIAELQVLAKDVEGYVPAEASKMGGVDPEILAGRQRPALE